MNFKDVPLTVTGKTPSEAVVVPIPVSVNNPSITAYVVDTDGNPITAAGTATLKAKARASQVLETVYDAEGAAVTFDFSTLDDCSFEIEKVSVGSVTVTPTGLAAGQFVQVIVNR